jgi:hypothetical protein
MDLFYIPYDEDLGSSTNKWRPAGVIEGYKSLIWTERYQAPGSFVLTTERVNQTLDKIIPYGYSMHIDMYLGRALLAVRGSNTIMMIESMEIASDDQGRETLTLSGRSLDAFLQYRTLWNGPHGVAYSPQRNYTKNELALVLMWNAVASGLSVDVIVNGAARNVREQIADLNIGTTLDAAYGTSEPQYLNNGTVLDAVKRLMIDGDFGIRSRIAPVDTTRISVGTTGIITRTSVTDDIHGYLETYRGVDRTIDQSTNPPILLHYDSGHFGAVKNLWTMTNRTSEVQIVTDRGKYEYPSTTDRYGLDRKLLFLDGGSPPATVHYASPSIAEWRTTKQYYFLEFAAADGAAIKPEVDYFLGDTISVKTRNYIGEANVLVNEMIRSYNDSEGLRLYPGFITVPDT